MSMSMSLTPTLLTLTLLLATIGHADANDVAPPSKHRHRSLRRTPPDKIKMMTDLSLLDKDEDEHVFQNADADARARSGLRKAKVDEEIHYNHRILQTTYNFTFVGAGACLDASSIAYDYVAFHDILDAAACADQCETCPGQNQAGSMPLLGFTYDTVTSVCTCHVEDGYTFTGTVCTGAIRDANLDNEIGTGEIASADGTANKQCWKVSNPEDPSMQPPDMPLSQPSGILVEPSSTPSCTPSSAPTEAPSTSRQDGIVFLFYPQWTGFSDTEGCR
jgi:hypothetical protein